MLSVNAVLQQNRYRIVQPIENSGSNFPSYKAFDEEQKREVVLKELPEESSSKIKPEKLLDLKHEVFQKVIEIFSEGGKRYLVMEMVEGDTLNQLIDRNKRPFPLSDVANWANDLLDALIYLHSHLPPLIHQNIKPQNLRLTLDGKIRLDISEIGRTPQAKVGATITNQNLHFIPFEIIFDQLDPASQKVLLNDYDEKAVEILKQPADVKSDIYSLGATLYYLLTARPPVDALERSIDMLEGKPDPLVSPTQYNPKVPPEIAEAIIKALEIKRENRFDSAAIMRQFLKTAFVRIKEKQKTEPITVETNLEDILEIESEPVPVVDLMRKLQEAEAKRLEAEKRAAEAEKKLKESFSARAQDLGVGAGSVLFTEEEEVVSQGMSKKKLSMIAVATVVFLIVGGIVFALLNTSAPPLEKQTQMSTVVETKSNTTKEENQMNSDQPAETGSVRKDDAAIRSERQAQERIQERSQERRGIVPMQRTDEIRQQPKQEQPAQKQQPKKVTVDDLINDN